MKKLLLSAASMLLLFGSCSQNELEENILSNDQNLVSATIEGQVDSRLAVEHDKSNNLFKLSWSTDDSFKVFDKSEGAIYVWSSENDFTESTTPTNPTYAVYPYEDTNSPTISGSTVTMTLNATPSVANVNLPMWAVPSVSSEGINYAFKHLAAALRFTLNDIPAGYNQLIVTASNAISGSFVANLSDTEPTLVTTATTLTDDVKTVTVSFTAATGTETKNEVFYIPLPVGTYESLSVSVGSDNSSETKELKSWTNLEVVRGKMYYTTATVDAASVDAVNEALANVGEVATTVNLTEAIDASAGALDIPDAAKDVTLNFAETPTTSESAPLTINQNDGETSGTATSELNVTMPSTATGLYATIDAPTTTVTLNGGSYSKVTATTATNTLIIGEGVTIEELVIEGGNVVLKGNVGSISSTVATIVTLDTDIDITETITIDGDVTINLNGHNIDASSNTSRPFEMGDGSSLTIEGGTSTITVGAYGLINIPAGNDAEVILNGGVYEGETDNGAFIKPRGTGKISITMDNVKYTDSSTNGYVINCGAYDGEEENLTILITGGEYRAGGGFQICGTIDGAKITTTNSSQLFGAVEFVGNGTIKNSEVTSTGYAVATGFGADATVTDCTVEGDVYAYCVYPTGGTINVTDGSYEGDLYIYDLYADAAPAKITIDDVEINYVKTTAELGTAIANGGYIALGANIGITETITIDGDVTINLNGHNIDASSNTSRPFEMGDGSSLTIEGGTSTITVGAYGLVNIPADNAATVTLNGGVYEGNTDNGAFIKPRGTGKISITMDNVKYTDSSTNGYVINCGAYDGEEENLTILITGGEYKAGGGFQICGTIDGAKITTTNSSQLFGAVEFVGNGTIKNSEVTSTGYAVATGFGADATVTDCTVKGDVYAYCVYQSGGTITVTGGTYTGSVGIYGELYADAVSDATITIDGDVKALALKK